MFEGMIGTLIGTILGFFLSEWSTLRKEERTEKKQAKSIKMMISLEIDCNLKALHEFWLEVNQTNNQDKDINAQKRIKAGRFVRSTSFLLSREVLDSHLSVISIALQEQESVQVIQFYDRIRRLEAIRSSLFITLEKDEEEFLKETTPGPAGFRMASLGYRPFQTFTHRAEELWNECESIVAQIFAKGNPLK